jgi:hypothetical protein
MCISLQPARPSGASELHSLHRPFHFLAFALTTFVLWRFFAAIRSPFPPSRGFAPSGLTSFVATFALGWLIEALQHFIYRNPMEWWDVRDDGLAALGALLVGSVVRYALATRKHPA